MDEDHGSSLPSGKPLLGKITNKRDNVKIFNCFGHVFYSIYAVTSLGGAPSTFTIQIDNTI
jgi:hypothetical protein